MKKVKRRRLKKWVKNLIKVVLLLFIILLMSKCFFNHKDTKNNSINKTKKIIEKINDSKKTDILKNIKKLYKINNDLVGYLVIPDTKINYPVMYTKGKDYYLRRDFNKNKNTAGTLYIDKYNMIEPRDTNLIIYGHNMNNDGTMFHDLELFREEDFYKKHKNFFYYTLKEKEEYEIVSVFISEVYRVIDEEFKYYKFYNADDKEDMDEYLKNIKKLSLYDTGVDIEYGDELLTLSTCEYSKENSRFVVVAKKVK